MNDLLRRLLFLPEEGSTFAPGVDSLHAVVISTTMLGAAVTFVVVAGFLYRYRRGAGARYEPAAVGGGKGEALVAALLLSLFIGFWVVGFRQFVAMQNAPDGALTMFVVAKQWMWKFTDSNGLSSIDVLTVPVGRPVKLVMTSRDVIHSFYVPAFRIKRDVLPGRYVSTWFEASAPGAYQIFCAEYCGTSHSGMLGTVLALGPEDYARWLEGRRLEKTAEGAPEAGADLVAIGRAVATRRACLACHTVDGQAHVGPTWRGLFNSEVRLTDGRAVKADEAYLTRSMMSPAADVVEGYKAVMPTYFGVLDEPEVAALVAFIKSIEHPGPPAGVVLPPVESPGPSTSTSSGGDRGRP